MKCQGFRPAEVIRWFGARPTWQKVLLAVPLVLALVAAVLWFVMRGRPSAPGTVITAAGDAHDRGVADALERIDARDREAAAVSERERAERDARKAEGAAAAARREEDHAAIDDASSIGDVDAVVYGRRRRR